MLYVLHAYCQRRNTFSLPWVNGKCYTASMSNRYINFLSSTLRLHKVKSSIFSLIPEYHTPGNINIGQEYLFSAEYSNTEYSNTSIVGDGQLYKFRLNEDKWLYRICSQHNNTYCNHRVVFMWCPESAVPEIIDPVFAKTSPKRSFSMTEYERFGLVFTKTRVYKFGHSW